MLHSRIEAFSNTVDLIIDNDERWRLNFPNILRDKEIIIISITLKYFFFILFNSVNVEHLFKADPVLLSTCG